MLDTASSLTIGVTLVLFVVALFLKGLTHDLLLEAGVFLVSVKLVIMSHKSALLVEDLQAELQAIRHLLETRGQRPG
jgi:hypothetical protein